MMADYLLQRKIKTLKMSTHDEVQVLLLKGWINDFKKTHLVFDCEQFPCYPTENTPGRIHNPPWNDEQTKRKNIS